MNIEKIKEAVINYGCKDGLHIEQYVAAKEIIDQFDPDAFTNVMAFAKAANGGRNHIQCRRHRNSQETHARTCARERAPPPAQNQPPSMRSSVDGWSLYPSGIRDADA